MVVQSLTPFRFACFSIMNLQRRVKEEEDHGETMSFVEEFHCPQAMKRFEEAAPPPFLTKTYEIVDDPATNHVVSWSRENNSFVVWDIQSFSMHLLPKYFKHNNFSSFVRQLNTYGFRKVDPERWEFANENFLRGETHLLNKIWRRKAASSQHQVQNQALDSCGKSVWFGHNQEDDVFKREKQALTEELINIRQQNQRFKAYLLTVEDRLRKTEMKQTQMMSFFLAGGLKKRSKLIIAQQDTTKQPQVETTKKRRSSIYQWPAKFGAAEMDQIEGTDEKRCVKTENFIRFVEDDYEFLEVDEVAAMKMEDVGERIEEASEGDVERGKVSVTRDKDDLDDGFWEELLKGCIKE